MIPIRRVAFGLPVFGVVLMASLWLSRPRDEILGGHLVRPAGHGRFTPKRGNSPRLIVGQDRALLLPPHETRGYLVQPAPRPVITYMGQSSPQMGAPVPPAGGGGGGGAPARAWFADLQTRTTGSQADADVLDGSKFSSFTGPGNWLTCYDSTGLGFPSGLINVWRIELGASTTSRMCRTQTGHWNTPAVGSACYYRDYFRVDFANGFDTGGAGSNHFIESNGLGQVAWEWKYVAVAGGKVTIRWVQNPLETQFPFGGNQYIYESSVFNRAQTYRREWKLNRTATNSAVPEVRFYDSSENLVLDTSTFLDINTGASMAAEAPVIDMSAGDGVDAQFQDFSQGNNGPQLGSRDHSEYMYHGPYAAGLVDWLGAWNSTDH